MKRTLKYALTAVLGAAFAAPAFAQDNFPDVPDNHWAFEALARMKRDGLLVGYPDGLFRGTRPASRYEMAVAIHATYVHLKNITDSLQQQLEAIRNAGAVNPADIQALKDAVANLQNQVNAMGGLRDDVANLKRLTDTFQKELQSLGVDVEAMKKDLADLDRRVSDLEKRKPAVDISGDVNLLLLAGNSVDGNYGLNKDGRLTGVATDANGAGVGPAGLTRDLSILHEGAFTLAGTNDTGPKWRGTIVIGNMLQDGNRTALGNQSSFFATGLPYGEPTSDWYVQDLGVKFDTSIVGLAFNAEVGRIGYKISPYIFQRPDNTTYYANERWDDGMWRFDGAILGFNFGGAKLDVFGGKNSRRLSTNGVDINPMVVGADFGGIGGNVNNGLGTLVGADNRAQIDRSLGANLNIPLSTAGNVNLAYLFLDSDTDRGPVGNQFNRVSVFGGSASYNVGGIKLEGGATQTNYQANNTNVVTSDNNAYYGKISYAAPSWSIFGQYREIAAGFAAPGDWGRLGVIRNPVNIKGFQVGGTLDIAGGLMLSAMGEFDKGKDDGYAGATGFTEDTKITKYEVKLGYNFTPNLNAAVGFEENRFEGVVGALGAARPDAKYRWYNLDIGYGLSEAARLLLRYEVSDVTNDYQVTGGGGRFKGGFLTTQLSLKF